MKIKQEAHLRSLIRPSIDSPSFNTHSLSLLRKASRICGSTSVELASGPVMLCGSSLINSGKTELRDCDAAQSPAGGVEGDGDMLAIPALAGCAAADTAME